MTQNKPLRGTFTALVTPMNADGSLDFGALDALVDAQIAGGVEGLVPCGTTGEAATQTAAERAQVVARVVKRAAKKVIVIAGTGTNSTAESVELQKRALDVGVDCSLVVTPYYNRPSPEGLYRHYAAIAEAVDLPIVAYNVPTRTSLDMKPETVVRLATIPHVVGIKEATGDITRVSAIRRGTGPGFALLSGDDPTTLPFVLAGGDGVIAVVSNVEPRPFSDMVRSALAGKVDEARAADTKLRDLYTALALEVNPLPVKTALHLRGAFAEAFRLPLAPMTNDNKKKLEAALRSGGWLR